jgi:hypothetical protein
VVDIVLGDGQLVLSVLQLGTGIIKEVRLDIVDAVCPHQLVVQPIGMRLKMVVLLEELSVALLDVLDNAVLFLHPVIILLQAQALEGASHRDLLK